MKIKVIAVGVILTILAAYIGMSIHTASAIMKIPRVPLEETLNSITYEDISFPSRVDSIMLRGWYIQAGTPCVIIVNGGYQNRIDSSVGTLELTRDLMDRGYSVLLFDFRGRGESKGKAISLTYGDRDIGGAIDYIISRGHITIYIIGFSSGAIAPILLTDNITAIVLDSCFADVHDMFIRGAIEKGYLELLARVLSPGVFLAAKVFYGYQLVDIEGKVGGILCPILFIHSEEDSSIPVVDAYRLYEASSNSRNSLWVVPGAGHCQAYKTSPGLYVDKIVDFFERSPK